MGTADANIAIETIQDRQNHQMQSLLAFPFDSSEPLAAAIGADDFQIRAAGSRDARQSASFLVNRLYASRGYTSNTAADEGSSNRLTLVASEQDAVVGTLTIRFDSDERLLADALFPDEVDALRGDGRSLCEFTKLAMDHIVRSQRVLAAMFHVAFIHAYLIRGSNSLMIEVNPRHVRFYQAKLGFKVIGPERLNCRVNAPAVLLALDLRYAKEQIARFGGKPKLSTTERSLYPFAFSPLEESGIANRLRGGLHS